MTGGAYSLIRRVPGHGYTFRVDKHLFSQVKFIPTQRNSPPGIIFSGRNHPYSEESASRDYFSEPNSSLLRRICFQGLFSQDEIIPIQRNLSAEMIFPNRNHPYSKEFVSRDYFPEANSSPLKRIRLQGCFGNIKGILQGCKSNLKMHGKQKQLPVSAKARSSFRSPPNPRKQFQDAWRPETASGKPRYQKMRSLVRCRVRRSARFSFVICSL